MRHQVAELVRRGVLRVEDGNHGNDRPRPNEFVAQGVAFIRAADMTSGVVNFEQAGRINAQARARIRKGVGAPGDVILSHKGTVGRIAVAPLDSPDYVCSPQTTFWRSLDPAVLDQAYLAFVLRSPDFQRQLEVLKGQTDMAPYVSLTDQRSMSVELPARSEQRAIAEVLGALDDKIAAIGRVVVTADELACAEWLAALSGEAARSLSAMARFVNGKAFTKGASGTGRVVIRIAELNSGLGGSTVYNDIDVADDHLARPGDLLFAWSGSLTAARWFRDEGIVNQHIFKCIPTEELSVAVVNQALRSGLTIFKGIAADKATTMGHIQRKHLDLEVPVPPVDRLSEVMPRLDALWNAALAAERESLALARTRDALIPLLMSGKLRIKDVEHEIAEVL